jgi:Ca2+-binding RTX toxin-like protein
MVDWSDYDSGQIIESTSRLKVETPAQELAIDHNTDSIRVGDGNSLATMTPVAAKVGLDVNVIGGVVSGEFSSSGLKNGLRTTKIVITDVPTKVPASALADRNGISIRVWGSNTVYFGGSDVTSDTGYPKRQFEEIVADIKDDAAVELYAVCDEGATSEVRVLELA